MRKERNIRNILVFSLCILVIFMGVGFSYMQQQLNVKGTANIEDATWDIQTKYMGQQERLQ